MLKEHRRNPLVGQIYLNDFELTTGCIYTGGQFWALFLSFFFLLTELQIGEPASFVPNSLSVPSTQNRCQVFLHGHLLSIAAVAVGEDPI